MEKYKRNENTVSGRLHDELVMMDIDRGKYYSLNNVSTRLWDLLEEWKSIDELCAVLTDEYDVKPEQCREEVSQILEEMQQLNLVFKGADL